MRIAPFAVLFLLLAPASARASILDGWTLEVKTGDAASLPLPVKFVQNGYEDVNFTARWDTRALNHPLYYSYRIGHWSDGKAWELEMLHHKLFLTNTQPEVTDFTVAHGYTLWTLNRARLFKGDGLLAGCIGRLGLGVVVAHPGGEVNGLPIDDTQGFNKGFYIAGPASQASLERRFVIAKGLFLSVEAKLTAAYARIPLYEYSKWDPTLTGQQLGHIDVPNVAVHGLVGLGYGF